MTNTQRYVADGHGSIKLQTATLKPGPGQVLLRTLYAGVNRGDILGLGGAYGAPFPAGQPVGQDVVGIVEAAGSPELRGLVGATLFGQISGAWAAHVVADASVLAPVGELKPSVAATLPLPGFTALRLARDASRTLGGLAGRRALITGGTGAVGGLLTELLEHEGAEVWLLSRKAAGGSPERTVATLAGAPRFDLAFESVGGPVMDRVLKQLALGAHLWWFGEVTREPVTLNFFDYLGSPWTLHHFSSWVHDGTDATDLAELARLAHSRVITPPGATVIGADALPEALHKLAAGSVTGKVVVEMGQLRGGG